MDAADAADDGGPAPLAARADAVWPPPAAAALAQLALLCVATKPKDRPADVAAVIKALKDVRALADAGAAALVSCDVCLCDVPPAAALVCRAAPPAAKHAACHGCLQEHVARVCAAPAWFTELEGRVPCTACSSGAPKKCAAEPWTAEELDDELDKGTRAVYTKTLKALLFDAPKQAAAKRAEREEQERRAGDEAVPLAERVRLLRAVIVDRDLTLHCPACAVAFDDYDACNALTCGKCACHFCGLVSGAGGGGARVRVRRPCAR